MYAIDVVGLEELKRALSPRVVDQALTSTLNKTAAKAKTAAGRAIRAEYAVKARTVNKALTLKRARRGRVEALLLAAGRRLPLTAFGARQTRRGVTVRVKKASGRKRIDRAFLARMPTGHAGVFWRQKQGGRLVGRLPIEELLGPSVPGMFGSPEAQQAIADTVAKDAPVLFGHELSFYVRKAARR